MYTLCPWNIIKKKNSFRKSLVQVNKMKISEAIAIHPVDGTCRSSDFTQPLRYSSSKRRYFDLPNCICREKKQTFSMYEIILLINSYKKDPQIFVQSCIKFPTTWYSSPPPCLKFWFSSPKYLSSAPLYTWYSSQQPQRGGI